MYRFRAQEQLMGLVTSLRNETAGLRARWSFLRLYCVWQRGRARVRESATA